MKRLLKQIPLYATIILFATNFKCSATTNNEISRWLNTKYFNSMRLSKQFFKKTNNLAEIKKDLFDNYKDKKTVRILSFDGGGTRGYLQCKFLDCLYKQIGISDDLISGDEKNKISKNKLFMNEVFDLVAGTSVGGMNAIGIANGITPTNMMRFYREKAPWIFTTRGVVDCFSNNASYPSNKPNLAKKIAMVGSSNPLYKSTNEFSNYGDARLKQELSNMFGDKLLTSIKTPVLLTGYNYSGLHPVAFTNSAFSPVTVTIRNVKIVDALMATAAAPIYFPSYQVHASNNTETEPDSIVDGGLFQNNPSVLAFAQARKLFPSAEKFCLLSLGTGIKDVGEHKTAINAKQSEIAVNKYLNLLNISMYCGVMANDMILRTLAEIMPDFFYYRFNFRLAQDNDFSIDTSTPEIFNYFDHEVVKEYKKDMYAITRFIHKAFGG